MSESIFMGLFDGGTVATVSVQTFLLCIGTALVLGLFLALTYSFRSHTTRSFVATLAILPAVVCVVIMMVNGNVGAGVAVAGAFGLVRFRSAPGTAREIGTIFLAMAAGLITGMGYLAYAVLFTLILGLALLLCQLLIRPTGGQSLLRITVPEDHDYTQMFDDVFARYTKECETVSVKTTNMGSLFRLTYRITMKDTAEEKAFIDALRCRNGNLEVSISQEEADAYAL